MSFYHYCPKCGNIISIDNVTNCNFCNGSYIATKYEWSWNDKLSDPQKRKVIFEKYVKPNPLFDEKLYNKRVGVEKAQEQATLDQMRIKKQLEQQANKPKCPTCGSTNVEKISTAKKAFGFAMVGLFSSNLGKTMHCRNCGYKW